MAKISVFISMCHEVLKINFSYVVFYTLKISNYIPLDALSQSSCSDKAFTRHNEKSQIPDEKMQGLTYTRRFYSISTMESHPGFYISCQAGLAAGTGDVDKNPPTFSQLPTPEIAISTRNIRKTSVLKFLCLLPKRTTNKN